MIILPVYTIIAMVELLWRSHMRTTMKNESWTGAFSFKDFRGLNPAEVEHATPIHMSCHGLLPEGVETGKSNRSIILVITTRSSGLCCRASPRERVR